MIKLRFISASLHTHVHVMYSRTGFLMFGPKGSEDLEELEIKLSEHSRPFQVFSAAEVQ